MPKNGIREDPSLSCTKVYDNTLFYGKSHISEVITLTIWDLYYIVL